MIQLHITKAHADTDVTVLQYPGTLEQAIVAAGYYAERNDIVVVIQDGEEVAKDYSAFYRVHIMGEDPFAP